MWPGLVSIVSSLEFLLLLSWRLLLAAGSWSRFLAAGRLNQSANFKAQGASFWRPPQPSGCHVALQSTPPWRHVTIVFTPALWLHGALFWDQMHAKQVPRRDAEPDHAAQG